MSDDTYGVPPTGAPVPAPPGPVSHLPPPVGPPVTAIGGPQPLGAASTAKNWMGITSLALGCAGGGLLGLGFGLAGMRAAKRGEATNRTMAMWGAILNVAVPAVVVGAFALASVFGDLADEDLVKGDQLTVGECIEEPRTNSSGELSSEYLTRVPCEELHWAQVYSRAAYSGSEYPGDDEMIAIADEICIKDAAVARIDPALPDWYYTALMPTRESFAQADRTVICLVTDEDEELTGDFVTN